MKILAIETSCDETAIAIIEISGSHTQPEFQVLSHLVSSQIELHAQFGGVVPNLAKREHERLLVPLLIKALKESGIWNRECGTRIQNSKFSARGGSASGGQILNSILEREAELLTQVQKKIVPLPIPDIDAIAVTNGPGLAPALWAGINFAKALAFVWKKPIIPVNHMKGHLYSALLKRGKNNGQFQIQHFKFPLIALLVSGGHTELVLMKKFGDYAIIGETLDDAAGEAFDKVARMMKLGYPGGPAIAVAAQKNTSSVRQFSLPRPMMSSKDYNFSFSGLKTAVLYALRDMPKGKRVAAAMAKEFQDAVVDVLVAKTIRAVKEYHAKTLIVGGGVSANHLLREQLAKEVSRLDNVRLFMPDRSLTGDNALMIAIAAYIDGKKKAPNLIGAEANMRL